MGGDKRRRRARAPPGGVGAQLWAVRTRRGAQLSRRPAPAHSTRGAGRARTSAVSKNNEISRFNRFVEMIKNNKKIGKKSSIASLNHHLTVFVEAIKKKAKKNFQKLIGRRDARP